MDNFMPHGDSFYRLLLIQAHAPDHWAAWRALFNAGYRGKDLKFRFRDG